MRIRGGMRNGINHGISHGYNTIIRENGVMRLGLRSGRRLIASGQTWPSGRSQGRTQPWSYESRQSSRPPMCKGSFESTSSSSPDPVPDSSEMTEAPKSSDLAVSESKRAILSTIAARPQIRSDILRAIKTLENKSGAKVDVDDLQGRWVLVYSTQLAEPTDVPRGGNISGDLGDILDGILQSSTAALYRLFFKFAPFLAGSQSSVRSRPTSTSASGEGEGEGGAFESQGAGDWGFTRNEQLVDLKKGLVNNTVIVTSRSMGVVGRIFVLGECLLSDETTANLDVVFTSFELGIKGPGPISIGPVSIPLPRPRGSLKTSFCDDDFRISRGGRGGVFVLKRLKDLR